MHAPQRLAAHKSLQTLDPQRKFAQRQRAVWPPIHASASAGDSPLVILRAINDPQIFTSTAFDRRLNQPPFAADRKSIA